MLKHPYESYTYFYFTKTNRTFTIERGKKPKPWLLTGKPRECRKIQTCRGKLRRSDEEEGHQPPQRRFWTRRSSWSCPSASGSGEGPGGGRGRSRRRRRRCQPDAPPASAGCRSEKVAGGGQGLMVLLLGKKTGGLPNKVVLGAMKYLMKVLLVF